LKKLKNQKTSKNKEIVFYVAIFIVVIAYLIATCFIETEPLSKRITTSTALISAVAFWLQFKRTERLNEANFIKDLNNQFVTNKDMTYVEHELELYYNQYTARLGTREKMPEEEIRTLYLGISQSRTGEDCQKMINYLVYLESLAALEGRRIIHLDVIDDLFSYRFFLAVNNPVVQENELYPYKDFYKGIFRLSEKWVTEHEKGGIPIPMKQFCLSEDGLKAYQEGKRRIRLDIDLARGNDNKVEIGRCIYDTDRYIYPEAFGEDREIAAQAISRLIGMDRYVFDYKNLLLARYNGHVCGVCLFSDGEAVWNGEAIRERLGKDDLAKQRQEGFDHAESDYFKHITERNPGENHIELVACCVDEGYQRKGVAKAMLDKLVEIAGDRPIRLTVLFDNEAAINLYSKKGFTVIEDDIDGFSPKGLIPPKCKIMERRSKE